MNRNYAHLLALFIQMSSNSTQCFGAGTHSHNHIRGLRIAIVVEEFIFTAGNLRNLSHIIFHNRRQLVVIIVNCFTGLEINIRILSSTTDNRVIRIQSAFAEFSNSFFIQQFFQIRPQALNKPERKI